MSSNQNMLNSVHLGVGVCVCVFACVRVCVCVCVREHILTLFIHFRVPLNLIYLCNKASILLVNSSC